MVHGFSYCRVVSISARISVDRRYSFSKTQGFLSALKYILLIFLSQCFRPSYGTAGPFVGHAFQVGTSPTALAVSDLNRDGIPDLVVANYGTDDISILLGLGGGGFRDEFRLPCGRGPRSVAIEDFNEDGVPDVAVADTEIGRAHV